MISQVAPLITIATYAAPIVRVGSPIDSSSDICSDASRDASCARPDHRSSVARPVMPIAREALSPAAVHNSRSSSKRSELSDSAARQLLTHSMVRGVMRIAVRSRSSSGSASAIRRARSQLIRAAAMSRLVDHPLARICQPYATCRSPAASKCSAISAALSSAESRVPLLGSRRQAAGAIRRDRISAATRKPPRGSADGGTHTPRCAVNFT